jgi:hypothetical protein
MTARTTVLTNVIFTIGTSFFVNFQFAAPPAAPLEYTILDGAPKHVSTKHEHFGSTICAFTKSVVMTIGKPVMTYTSAAVHVGACLTFTKSEE